MKIANDGKILVKSGDWLSKYSMAIYRGDGSKVKEFGRLQLATMRAIVNVSMISPGETIYHVPTYNAFRSPVKTVPVKTTPVKTSKPATVAPHELRLALVTGKTTFSMLSASFRFGENLVKLVSALTGVKPEEIDKQIKSVKRGAELIDCIVSAFECTLALERGGKVEASSHALISVGSAWSFLPEAKRRKLRQSIKSGLGRSKRFKGLETGFEGVEKLEGVGDFTKMVACLGLPTSGRSGKNDRLAKFNEGAKGLIKKLNDKPTAAIPLLAPLAAFIARLIPVHTREKLLAKMVSKKVPVIGTLIVGISDIVDICQAPDEAKAWMSLGSTIAGVVPVAGTALSAVIDIGVLVMTAVDTIHELVEVKESIVSLNELGVVSHK